MEDFREQGWDIDLQAHIRHGGKVLGICGGYQMLGKTIHDPKGIEGPPKSVKGLGLLDIETTMSDNKILQEVTAQTKQNTISVKGYEIHIGKSSGKDLINSWLTVDGKSVSAATSDGSILGCYIHGIFSNDTFRSNFIESLGATPSNFNFNEKIDSTLDLLSKHVEQHVNIDKLISLAR